MQRRTLLAALAAACLAAAVPARADGGLVVIAHSALRGVDAELLRRVYAGRAIEVDGRTVRPVNLAAGHPVRQRFFDLVLRQSDDDFVAYWTVRRYVGKGAPPRELATPAEVIEYVRSTPGAIGYVEATDLKPGVQVVWKP